MPADNEMPDVSATLGQIVTAKRAVQEAMGNGGRLRISMPPQMDKDHDVVIWNALSESMRTIGNLSSALDRAQRERDAFDEERTDLANELSADVSMRDATIADLRSRLESAERERDEARQEAKASFESAMKGAAQTEREAVEEIALQIVCDEWNGKPRRIQEAIRARAHSPSTNQGETNG